MKKLAVFAPNLGARSETFIQRHMSVLLPGQVVVVAGSDEPPYNGHWDVDCPKLVLSRMNQPLSWKHQALRAVLRGTGLKRYPGTLDYIKTFLIQNQVEVILSEYLDHSLPYLELAKQLGIRLYAHAHGYDVSANLQNPYWRKEYLRLNEAAGVITMTEISKNNLIELGIKVEKIKVMPYGIPLPDLQPFNYSTNEVIKCLAIGRMVSKKAPILLLDSFKRALDLYPNLRLDYVGAGDLYISALHYVQAYRLEDKVHLHGNLPHEQVLSMVNESDIFLQHSATCPITGDQEGMPIIILEAMAQAKPVVSTIHSGIPDEVVDGETGFLVQEGDTQAMAERIVQLATDQSLRFKMGEKAYMRIKNCFTWERERENLLNYMGIN